MMGAPYETPVRSIHCLLDRAAKVLAMGGSPVQPWVGQLQGRRRVGRDFFEGLSLLEQHGQAAQVYASLESLPYRQARLIAGAHLFESPADVGRALAPILRAELPGVNADAETVAMALAWNLDRRRSKRSVYTALGITARVFERVARECSDWMTAPMDRAYDVLAQKWAVILRG